MSMPFFKLEYYLQAQRLPPSHFPVLQLPLALILEALSWCSPIDLFFLRKVSRSFRVILDQHKSLCWARARNNLIRMPALPSLPTDGITETTFISYLFLSSGKCSGCGGFGDNVVPNLTYMVYQCTSPRCIEQFTPNRQELFFSYDPQDRYCRKFEPILPLLPSYDPLPEKKVYLIKQAKKELAWYKHLKSLGDKDMLAKRMADKTMTCRTMGQFVPRMHKWTRAYKNELAIVRKKNIAFLMTATHTMGLEYRDVLANPVIAKALFDFNQSLTCITLTVWRDIMTQGVRSEIQYARATG